MAEGEYKRLAVRTYPARAERETPEGRYWRKFKSPALLQQVQFNCLSSFIFPLPAPFLRFFVFRAFTHATVTRI